MFDQTNATRHLLILIPHLQLPALLSPRITCVARTVVMSCNLLLIHGPPYYPLNCRDLSPQVLSIWIRPPPALSTQCHLCTLADGSTNDPSDHALEAPNDLPQDSRFILAYTIIRTCVCMLHAPCLDALFDRAGGLRIWTIMSSNHNTVLHFVYGVGLCHLHLLLTFVWTSHSTFL